jgi:ubiquinone/menaquinone biosynthesis C-methylase UbiE
MSDLLGTIPPGEGEEILHRGRRLKRSAGILRDLEVADAGQAQTRDTFAYKWNRRETYKSPAIQQAIASWLHERYAPLLAKLEGQDGPLSLLDAGCGSGNSASLLFDGLWQRLRYVGADISSAVDIAKETISAATPDCAFVQCDLMQLPFPDQSFDVVFSEGVLHHTPSTHDAILATARLVRPGGLYSIYVYAKKSPAREFTDDYIREIVSRMPQAEAWEQLIPLSKLGKALGDLNVEVDVPEDVELLGIPKGKINIQRLFYWHFCKAFYRNDLTIDEMNHINFDWFTPIYSHRQTREQVEAWCAEAGLVIEDIRKEEAGITVLARRPAR